jgi:hypothetical protein
MDDAQKNTNSVVAWIALLVAVLALPVAVAAYNRSGEDLDATIEKKTAVVVNGAQDATNQVADNAMQAKNNAAESADRLNARTDFQTRLMKVQNEINTNQVTDQTITEIQSLRSDFRGAYSDASGDAKTQVDQMDQDLAKLETQVRQDTAAALSNIESMLERLKQDALTDNDNDGDNN